MKLSQYEEARDYLTEALRETFYRDKGESDEKIRPKFKAKIIDAFEEWIYYSDRCRRFFLIGTAGELMMYNGRYYESFSDASDVLAGLIKDVMRKLRIGIMYQKLCFEETARQCIKGMRNDERAYFHPDRRYIIFRNCVLDTKSGTVDDFDMKYHTDMILDFDYLPKATSPLWTRVLCQTIPLEDGRDAFQMFCGAFLADRSQYSVEYICYLVGKGRNGKSVVSRAIADMFGDRLVSYFSPQELLRDGDRRNNLASLVGKVANFSDDVRASDFSGGGLKQFVSGHKVSARPLYGKNFVLDSLPYLLCCVNEIPPTSDDTLGHHRRLLPIRCPNTVKMEDVDPTLSAKLSVPEVKAAIFNWVYLGYTKLMDAGGRIALSEKLIADMERCRTDSNSVRRWIRDLGLVKSDRFGKDSPDWRTFPELMLSYKRWCKMMGEPMENGKKVGMILSDLGFPRRRHPDGNGVNTTYYCIAIGAVMDERHKTEIRMMGDDGEIELPLKDEDIEATDNGEKKGLPF